VAEKLKKAQIIFRGGHPLEINQEVIEDISTLGQQEKSIVDQVGETMKTYLTTVERLLEGKYAHLKKLVPIHLSDQGNVLVGCCPDGVIIRFERKVDKKKVIVAWLKDELIKAIPILSEKN